MTVPLISLTILLALAAGTVLLFGRDHRVGRMFGLGVAALLSGLILVLLAGFKPSQGFQWVERAAWLPAIGLEYHLAADGISLVFLLLTAVVFPLALLASKHFAGADSRYYGLLLLLEGGLIGTFTAQNFLHFFVFWEVSLVPAFFLVRLYGGQGREGASVQFFLYTMVGSIGMLLAFLAIFLAVGSFDFAELARHKGSFGAALQRKLAWPEFSARQLGLGLFVLALAGTAVKIPLWPFHSWLPVTYAQAPTPVTMVLTGVMSKMGVYALIRAILPLFPAEMALLRGPLLTLAVITILYGAWAAFGERDIRRIFAYSSLSHLGYCLLGVFAAGQAGGASLDNERAAALNGVILQVLSHGVIGATLFAFVILLEQRSGGQRGLESFGGLRQVNPQLAGLMGVAVFASLGLPGLSGFPAEFLIFKGAFSLAPGATACAVVGLLLTAAYLLRFFGAVFYGPLHEQRAGCLEISAAEKWMVVPGVALAFLLGLAPQLAIQLFNPAVTRLTRALGF